MKSLQSLWSRLRRRDAPLVESSGDVAIDLGAAYDELMERERAIQHARRKLASLVVSQRLGDGPESQGLEEVERELRAAIDHAAVSLGSLRQQLDGLRSRLELGSARLELQGIRAALGEEFSDVADAMEAADSAALRLEAQALAHDEVASLDTEPDSR